MHKLWRSLKVGLYLLAIVLGFVLFFSATSFADIVIPSPPKNCPVLDSANILPDVDEQELCTSLMDYEAKTGNQIAVLTISSLEGGDIADYSNKVARAWGVGDKQANNGVLFVVAKNDRKMRIEVGRGLEPMLTDLQSNQIIRTKVRPLFQNGDYTGGIKSGTQSMIAVIGGERLSEPTKSSESDISSVVAGLLQFAFIPFIYLASFLGRSKSWWAGGVIGAIPGVVIAFYHLVGGIFALFTGVALGLLLDYLLSKNYQARASSGDDTTWWGSGGGFFGGSGGGGSGGWGGFGGGDFGGGGSSGDW